MGLRYKLVWVALLGVDILKVDFFCAFKTIVFKFFAKKKCKTHTKNHVIYVNHEEKTVKEVNMWKVLVQAYKSQDFAQSENFCGVARP